MNCKVCNREAVKEFCPSHTEAHYNLVTSYDIWRKALKISWKDYLSQVAENSSTGDWVKEVAEFLIEKEEK